MPVALKAGTQSAQLPMMYESDPVAIVRPEQTLFLSVSDGSFVTATVPGEYGTFRVVSGIVDLGAGSSIGTATGSVSIVGIGASVFASIGAVSSNANVNGVAGSIAASIGTASGIGSIAGTGEAVQPGFATSTGTAVGSSSITGAGALIAAVAGSSSGAALANGIGGSIAASTGASSGTSLVSGVGDIGGSVTSGTGASSGTAIANGAGASVMASVGNSTGVSVVSGAGSSTVATTGSISGVGTMAGVGSSVAQSTGSIAGVATVSGVGSTAPAPSSSAAAWLTGSDSYGLATMFEQSDGTVPVAVNSPIGRATNQIGTNHLIQATAAARPTIGGTTGAYQTKFDLSNSLSASVYPQVSKATDFTVEAIVLINTLTTDRGNVVFDNTNASADRVGVNVRNGRVNFGIYNGSTWSEVSSNAALTIGQYYRVSAVNDAGVLKLYIDGVAQSATTGDRYAFSNGKLLIGRNENDTTTFDGQISDVRIWNAARTQAAISADKAQRLAGTETNLIAYWPM